MQELAASLMDPHFAFMRVNVTNAIKYACTEYASRKMYGCLTHSQVVMPIREEGERRHHGLPAA